MLVSNSNFSFYSQVQSRDLNAPQALSESSSNKNTPAASSTDSVTISNSANDLASKELDIANRYDVRNLSETERLAMAKELFDNKLITPTQHAVMSFPIEEMVSKWPGYEGTYDPSQKIDYLQQSIDQLSFSKSGNASTQEIQSREQMISLLTDLDRIRNG